MLTTARLADDMWPFAKQVSEAAHHSSRALAGVRAGLFRPEIDRVPSDFAWLRSHIAEAVAALQDIDPGELDAIADRDMRFEFGSFQVGFTVSDFLLSLCLPNFHFHVTTAYAILRHGGVKIGKLDYPGKMRDQTLIRIWRKYYPTWIKSCNPLSPIH